MNNPQQGRGDYTGSAPLSLIVPATAGSRRLDQILAELLPQHSRNRLQTWVRDGRVHIDGVVETEPKRKLYGGEALLIWEALDTQVTSEQPEDIPLNIVYEDEALLVINKPAGLVVHPAPGHDNGNRCGNALCCNHFMGHFFFLGYLAWSKWRADTFTIHYGDFVLIVSGSCYYGNGLWV